MEKVFVSFWLTSFRPVNAAASVYWLCKWIQAITRTAAADYAVKPRKEWILLWPGMVVLCGSQIYWTQEVVDAMKGGLDMLASYEEKCTDQLQDLVKLVS